MTTLRDPRGTVRKSPRRHLCNTKRQICGWVLAIYSQFKRVDPPGRYVIALATLRGVVILPINGLAALAPRRVETQPLKGVTLSSAGTSAAIETSARDRRELRGDRYAGSLGCGDQRLILGYQRET